MKVSFEAPPVTTFAGLKEVARTTDAVTLEAQEPAPENVLEVERSDDLVRWRVGPEAITFSLSVVRALNVVSFQYSGRNYIATEFTFACSDGPRRYRLINSHESEAEWLRETASRIAAILGMPLGERTIGEID
jgi:hypothetical protein